MMRKLSQIYLWPLLVFLLFTNVSICLSQSSPSLSTGKKFVRGIVDSGTGHVQIKVFPGAENSQTLTGAKSSFITFYINGTYYTNNTQWLVNPVPLNVSYLNDGKLLKVADTVKCTWKNKQGIDIVQEVFPVLFDTIEQIVIRWKAVNTTTSSALLISQYLLDIRVNQTDVEDSLPIYKNTGYDSKWHPYSVDALPLYYSSFDKKNAFEGLHGCGLVGSTIPGFNIEKPSKFIIGDWDVYKRLLWSSPSPLPTGSIKNNAVFFEFSGRLVAPQIPTLLGSVAYGNGKVKVVGMRMKYIIFTPPTIPFETEGGRSFIFPIDMILISPMSLKATTSTKATIQTDSNLQVLTPVPISNNGMSQTQAVQPYGYMQPRGISHSHWTLKARKFYECQTNVFQNVKIIVTSEDKNIDILGNSLVGSDTFLLSLQLDCQSKDTLPPVIKILPASGPSTFSFRTFDTRNEDVGIRSIEYYDYYGTDTSNTTVSIIPPVTPCSRSTHTVVVSQKDTSRSGGYLFIVKDCNGFASGTTLYFTRNGAQKFDTLPPHTFTHQLLSPDLGRFRVVDSRSNDTGITYIALTQSDIPNIVMTVDPPLESCSKYVHTITVRSPDSTLKGCAYFEIKDCAGNLTIDSICFPGSIQTGVSGEQIIGSDISILGNPSLGKATIQLTLEKRQDVKLRIVDVVGKEVRTLDAKGLSQGENLIPLQTSDLASGTYYVIVEIDGKQFVKRLKVVW